MGKTTIADLTKQNEDQEKKINEMQVQIDELKLRLCELEMNPKNNKPAPKKEVNSNVPVIKSWYTTHKTLKAALQNGSLLANRETMIKDFGYDSMDAFCDEITNISDSHNDKIEFLKTDNEATKTDKDNLWSVLMTKGSSEMTTFKKKLSTKFKQLQEESTKVEAKRTNYTNDDPLLADAHGVDAEI